MSKGNFKWMNLINGEWMHKQIWGCARKKPKYTITNMQSKVNTKEGDQALPFNSRLKSLFQGKLKSRCSRSLTVTQIFSYSIVAITHLDKANLMLIKSTKNISLRWVLAKICGQNQNSWSSLMQNRYIMPVALNKHFLEDNARFNCVLMFSFSFS